MAYRPFVFRGSVLKEFSKIQTFGRDAAILGRPLYIYLGVPIFPYYGFYAPDVASELGGGTSGAWALVRAIRFPWALSGREGPRECKGDVPSLPPL